MLRHDRASTVNYADRHARLDLLYRVEDPWQLDCARERFRFDATNVIILPGFGRVGACWRLAAARVGIWPPRHLYAAPRAALTSARP
jgi:hypothetical protein